MKITRAQPRKMTPSRNSNRARVSPPVKKSTPTFHLVAASVTVLGIASVFALTVHGMESQNATLATAANQAVFINSTTTPSGPDAYARIALIGKSAIVYDLTNGQTLYAQNASTPLPLASITKLLTLYAASNILAPSSTVTMTAQSLAQNSDAADAGFSVGESFSFEDLARLTLAASSNNGAEAITEAADSAQTTDTSSLLAGAASAIGLTQTRATNGTGLDINQEIAGGYGSAKDIAILAGALLKKAPLIAQATTLSSVSIRGNQGTLHTFSNTDPDITRIPHPLLSKTGYTDLAGGNLVVVYDAGINHPIAIVVLGSTQSGRFADVQSLLRATLAHFAGILPT